jgi:putative transposase
MDQRLCFIAACLRADEPMNGLCLRFGISRKTGYKWMSRYRDFGAAGLVGLSSARHTVVPAIDPAITDAVVALRKQRRTWGPRKLLARLSQDRPEIVWPASSTIGDFLHREGLSKPRSRRARDPSRKQPEIEPSAANESWSADFKGWFRTGDGIRCEPLTVTDNYSRYLLACAAVPQITTAHVQPILTGLFRRHGLPTALRTDNGSPFASRTGLGGLAKLSVWLLKLDVWPDRIAPGRPDQNGRHERMHRTLGEDVAWPPAATVAEQQWTSTSGVRISTPSGRMRLWGSAVRRSSTARHRVAIPKRSRCGSTPPTTRSAVSAAMATSNGGTARSTCPRRCGKRRLRWPSAMTATGRSGSAISTWGPSPTRAMKSGGLAWPD